MNQLKTQIGYLVLAYKQIIKDFIKHSIYNKDVKNKTVYPDCKKNEFNCYSFIKKILWGEAK